MWDFKFRSFLHGLKDQADTRPAVRKMCDVPGCDGLGEFKAPKSRYDLRDYYWFCLDHVREYNAKWDFFKGMTPGEIQQHMNRSMTGDRPTWRSTEAGLTDDQLRRRIYEKFSSGETMFGDFSFDAGDDDETRKSGAHIDPGSIPHPTIEALSVMELSPPVDWDRVKARYKQLVKKYHPDTNKDADAEERLKKINMAYTILKLSYQHFTTLDDRS